MEITINPLQDSVSSVMIKTPTSVVICSLLFEQKTEQDPNIRVIFSTEENDEIQEIIRNIIGKTIVERNAVTQFQIYFYEVVRGIDSFSACVNAFSICAILGNINTINTLSSASIVDSNLSFVANMAYQIESESCINFYYRGTCEDVSQLYDRCVNDCKNNAIILKTQLSKYIS
ncbi:hypothetical protein P3W45_001582 [Vairimorpha bombi]|jgi:hypothetical protein